MTKSDDKKSNKIRVAVLYGGRSAEHEVSLLSAANVIQYLDPAQFEVVPMGIDKQGNWFLGKDVFLKSLENKKVPKLYDSMNTWFTPEWIGKPVDQTFLPEKINSSHESSAFDVVFPAVHGTLCEDGALQGLLELAGVPYVGCGVLSSAIGMDKDISKRLVSQVGIAFAPYVVIKQEQWKNNPAHFSKHIQEKLSYPVFVKPVNTGSSIGITKVKTEDQLSSAIEEAFQFDVKVIVEKALDIFELEVAVLESLESNGEPIVSVVGEIKPRHEFYSYDAKYIDENGAELIIPAQIPSDIQEKARQMAKEIFSVLECEGMARVDLFLDKKTQQIYFNEINTIPGFTKISMYPKLMQASGIDYTALLSHLIHLAMKKHGQKRQL